MLNGLGAQIVDVRMPDLSDCSRRGDDLRRGDRGGPRGTYPARASEYGPYMREFLAAARR